MLKGSSKNSDFVVRVALYYKTDNSSQHLPHPRIIVPEGVGATQTPLAVDQPTTSLQRALIRAHRWLAQLNNGQAKLIKVIAEKENVDNSYVSRIIHLTTLAPDIVSAILDDQVPSTLALEQLVSNPPWSWEEQRGRFGFQSM